MSLKRLWRFVNRVPGQVGLANEATRHAWVAEVLSGIPSGFRLLDAGCGEQQYRPLCAHLRYVSQDFAAYDGKGDGIGLQTGDWECRSRELDWVCDIASIPEPDASFDVILCTEVLEHVPDPVKALSEFSRLLKPDGLLVMTAPFCSISHFTPYHFSTGFSRYWYQTHLSTMGFRILDMRPNGDFYQYLAQELRRIPSIARRYGSSAAFLLSVAAHFVVVLPLLAVLNILSASQRGTSEMLCFGYHVLAQRQGVASQ